MNVKVELDNPMYPKVTQVKYKKLGRQKAFGFAYHETGIIEIDPKCKGIKHLEIVAHEALHIVAPFLSEEAVEQIAAEQARVLWKEGYRRADNDTSQKLQDETEEE